MTQTISTIVDPLQVYYPFPCLYDPNNFYYCRSNCRSLSTSVVYMTQTISTIVDSADNDADGCNVYMTQTISTIVDIITVMKINNKSI